MNLNTRQVVETFWALMAGNDFHAVGQVLSDDFLLEWPQSRERIRGRLNFALVNQHYPTHGPWTFTINRIVAGEDEAVSDVCVSDGTVTARAITFFEIRGGKIARMVEFWPEDYPAPANRRAWVEPIED